MDPAGCILTLEHGLPFVGRRFYDLVDPTSGILRKGREIRLTGCRLRNALSAGSVPPRLLPTEYVIILLDEVCQHTS